MKLTQILIVTLLFIGTTLQLSAENKPHKLNIMSYNVRGGCGIDNKLDYGRASAIISAQQPDICALQELDSITGRSRGVDALIEFAARTEMLGTYAKAINYDGGAYGSGLLHKEVPISTKRVPLPGREEVRVALVAEFPDYVTISTHLSLNKEDQQTSVQMLDSLAAEYPLKAVFLAGDLNFKPDSEQFKSLKKNFILLTDVKQNTYPADNPDRNIDYIWGYIGGNQYYDIESRGVIDAPIQSDHRPVFATVTYGNILRTDPYLQNPTDGGMTVTWLTNTPAYSWVEYGIDTADLKIARTLVDGQALAGNKLNKIRLRELVGGQKYYYRIHSREVLHYGGYSKTFGATATSPFYSFTLPSPDDTDFTALIFNDLHQRGATYKALLKSVRDRGIECDFAVFNGDCIDDPNTENQAVSILSLYAKNIGATNIPLFFIRGNHEIRGAYSIGLRDLFDYVGDKTYGAFNWGDTRFVMLDCGEDKPDDHWVYYGLNDFTGLRKDQVGFLQTELSSKAFKRADKRVLIHHIPIYGTTDEYNPCQELWDPELKKAPFDVALNAHTHRFAHHPAHSVGNNFPVVIGGGYKPDDATVMVLSKEGETLTLTVYDVDGNEKLKLNL